MTFSECIDLAVKDGKLKSKKADEAKQAYADSFASGVANGLSSRAADDMAAVEAVKALGQKAAARQWAKINEIRAAAEISDRMNNAARPDLALRHIQNQLEAAHDRIINTVHKEIENNLEKWRPRAAGLWVPTKDMDNIIRASFGDTRDPTAVKLYEEFAAAHDFLEKRLNLEGTLIQKAEGRRSLPMEQDRNKLAQLTRRTSAEQAMRDWIDFHHRNLDWNILDAKADEPILDRQAFLEKQYRRVLTIGNADKDPGTMPGGSLAARINRSEFFYYKDADSWLAAQEKYGSGNVYQQLLTTIDSRARQIALMETLGPNPETMNQFVKNLADRNAANKDLETGQQPLIPGAKNLGFVPNKKSMRAKVNEQWDTYNDRYKIFSRQVDNGSDNKLAQFLATGRTLAAAGVLGGAFISQIGDLGMAMSRLRLYNLPTTGILRRILTDFATMPSEERRRSAIRNGIALESMVTEALAAQKYLGPLDGAHWAKRWVADPVYRLSFMTAFTQGERIAIAEHLMGAFADDAGKSFGELPYRPVMEDWGINSDDWDKYRATPIFDPTGQKLLRPLDVLSRTDMDRVEAQRLSDKFHDLQVFLSREIVPTAGTETQAKLGGAVSGSTGRGMLLRMFGLVKSFNLIAYQYLKDAALDPTRGLGGRAANVGQMVLYVTLAGAAITQFKQMAQGNDPLPMNDMQFWIRSLLNGGSLGFAGDMLFGALGQYQHGGLADVLTGPEVGWLDKMWSISFSDTSNFLVDWAEHGEAHALKNYREFKDIQAFARQYAPIPWQGKLLFQRLLLDEITRQSDPAAYQRLRAQQSQRLNNGQGSWYGVGQQTPTRPPNLATAIGQK